MPLKNGLYVVAIALAVFASLVMHAHSQTAQTERRAMPMPTLHFPAGKDFVEVPFEVESGWVVIPVSVNGSRQLRFVLDSGAGGAVLTNPAILNSLNLNIPGKMEVRGAGGARSSSEVSVAENVTFDLAGIQLADGNLAIHALRPGVDGVIGLPIFAKLVVEIDWEKQVIRLYQPAKYKYSGSGKVLPLTFDEGGRPYTMASVTAAEKTIPVKLVVDTGGSHTLSLEVGPNSEIQLPEGLQKTVLGRGANGPITGYTGRVSALELGGQTFKDVPTIFPDSSYGTAAGSNGRQGNLGSGILRRFKVIYDYSRKQMIVDPNKFSNEPFGTVMPRPAASSITIARAILPDYVGKYGNKEISVKESALYYQRIGGSGAALRAIGKDKFALNSDAQIIFVRDANGVVTEMIIEWVERDKELLKREAPEAVQSNDQVVASHLTRNPQRIQPKMTDTDIIKETQTYLEQVVKEDAFSGAVLIAKDGKSIFEKAYGLANKGSNTPNNPETKFNLGSINKSFTGVAIAQLAQQGKLSFNDPISKYLPEYPNKTVASKVTIHQLLTHTSGMGMYFNEEFMRRRASLKTLADLLPLFVNDPLSFEPGEKVQYSNSGYVVLGLIIEKVTRQSYFDYVREHIFQLAGMKNTDSYELEQSVPNLATGYTNMGLTGRPEPGPRQDSTPHLTGKGNSAGGGYSTLEDMLKFGQALIGHKLLNQQYTDIILKNQMPPGQPASGYGFFSVEVNGTRAIGNNGGGPGINATFTVYPELGYTVVVMSNYDPPSASKVTTRIRELLTAK
jgi:CubicO group peptidase (beta-lactamase class C family)/predicted aspartyl protease